MKQKLVSMWIVGYICPTILRTNISMYLVIIKDECIYFWSVEFWKPDVHTADFLHSNECTQFHYRIVLNYKLKEWSEK